MPEFSLAQIAHDGYAILPGVFDAAEVNAISSELSAALGDGMDEAEVIRSRGIVCAARNVAELYPQVRTLWRKPALVELLTRVLGPEFGLVRVLYFDKPPERTWSLPWHKDLTIAVSDNTLATRHFSKPTTKAGVPHVEASLEVLQAMLTLRIHLDDVTDENGPLCVAPGSHRSGKESVNGATGAVNILVDRGGVLAIRPLVAHSSGPSSPDTTRRRRVLHLEFAGMPDLPDGYAWHDFWAGVPAPSPSGRGLG